MQYTTVLATLLAVAGSVTAQDAYGSYDGAAAAAAPAQAADASPSAAAAAAAAPSVSPSSAAAAAPSASPAPSSASPATNGSASASPDAASPGAMQVVQVGGAGGALTFSPNDIKAAPGSQIQFQFNPKNHSVVQSNFKNPCVPIAESAPGSAGFFSGYMPVAAGDTNKPTFTITVNDTKPIWFYCSQAKHCESGMVGAINAPETGNTLAAFTALANKAPATSSPGSGAAGGLDSASNGTSSSGTCTCANANPPTTASAAAPSASSGLAAGFNSTSNGSGFSTGVVVTPTASGQAPVQTAAAPRTLVASRREVLVGLAVAAAAFMMTL